MMAIYNFGAISEDSFGLMRLDTELKRLWDVSNSLGTPVSENGDLLVTILAMPLAHKNT
jgi:uncharacterized spore protein YtfJ